MATTRPICSFVRHAATAHTANGNEPILVEEPDRPEQEGRGERHGVEVVDDEPLGRRIEQVDDGEHETGPIAPEVLPREQIDGNRAEGDGDGLDDEQELRARPDPPQRDEEDDDRIEVRSEAGDLLAVDIGDLEEAAVRRRPDDLGEVADVESSRLERSLLEHREHGHARRERADGDPQQALGDASRRRDRPLDDALATAARGSSRRPAPRRFGVPLLRFEHGSRRHRPEAGSPARGRSGRPGEREARPCRRRAARGPPGCRP